MTEPLQPPQPVPPPADTAPLASPQAPAPRMNPVSGYPMPPQPSVPTRKGPLLWILAAVSAALLVGTGVLGYLWSAESSSSRNEINSQDAQIGDLEDSADQLRNGNARRRSDISDLKDDLADNQAMIEDLKECPAKVRSWVFADDAVGLAAAQEMIATCHLNVRISG